MLETVLAGKPFLLKDLVEYKKDAPVKKVIVDDNGAKLLVVALDHASLPDHPAPATAIFTVLDGDGELDYNGEKVKLHHGMSIKFDKGVIHSVTTEHKLKFMLMFF